MVGIAGSDLPIRLPMVGVGSGAHYGSCWSQLMVGHHLNLGAKAFCLSLLLFIKIEKGNPNALRVY